MWKELNNSGITHFKCLFKCFNIEFGKNPSRGQIRLIFEQAVGKCWGSRTFEALRFLRYLCRFISASLSRWKCVTESTQQKLKMGEKERNGTMRLDDEYGTIDCYFWNRTEQTKPGTHPLALFLSHFPTLTHSLTLCIPKQAMRVVVMYKLNFW